MIDNKRHFVAVDRFGEDDGTHGRPAGERWRLILECGHSVFRQRRRYRGNLRTKDRERIIAPPRCVICEHCTAGRPAPEAE